MSQYLGASSCMYLFLLFYAQTIKKRQRKCRLEYCVFIYPCLLLILLQLQVVRIYQMEILPYNKKTNLSPPLPSFGSFYLILYVSEK